MAVDAGDNAFVAGDFGVPPACLGVVAQGVNVGKLGFEDGLKLGGSDVVVALFADVGVGASVGDEPAGAVTVSDAGLEHLGSEPFDSVAGGATSGGDDEEWLASVHLRHGRFVGGSNGR